MDEDERIHKIARSRAELKERKCDVRTCESAREERGDEKMKYYMYTVYTKLNN